MYHTIQTIIDKIDYDVIPEYRKTELQVLVDFIQQKKSANQAINLNFICTHNSRRSQFSQVWAQVAADYYSVEINSFSGGVEVTACNERAIKSLERFGFKVETSGSDNPIVSVDWDSSNKGLQLFSKLFDDDSNPSENFAAIMTCSHADENCPFIPGAEIRIPIRYNDPKHFDDSPLEAAMYDCRSFEIASEMMYIFSKIK